MTFGFSRKFYRFKRDIYAWVLLSRDLRGTTFSSGVWKVRAQAKLDVKNVNERMSERVLLDLRRVFSIFGDLFECQCFANLDIDYKSHGRRRRRRRMPM